MMNHAFPFGDCESRMLRQMMPPDAPRPEASNEDADFGGEFDLDAMFGAAMDDTSDFMSSPTFANIFQNEGQEGVEINLNDYLPSDIDWDNVNDAELPMFSMRQRDPSISQFMPNPIGNQNNDPPRVDVRPNPQPRVDVQPNPQPLPTLTPVRPPHIEAIPDAVTALASLTRQPIPNADAHVYFAGDDIAGLLRERNVQISGNNASLIIRGKDFVKDMVGGAYSTVIVSKQGNFVVIDCYSAAKDAPHRDRFMITQDGTVVVAGSENRVFSEHEALDSAVFGNEMPRWIGRNSGGVQERTMLKKLGCTFEYDGDKAYIKNGSQRTLICTREEGFVYAIRLNRQMSNPKNILVTVDRAQKASITEARLNDWSSVTQYSVDATGLVTQQPAVEPNMERTIPVPSPIAAQIASLVTANGYAKDSLWAHRTVIDADGNQPVIRCDGRNIFPSEQDAGWKTKAIVVAHVHTDDGDKALTIRLTCGKTGQDDRTVLFTIRNTTRSNASNMTVTRS